MITGGMPFPHVAKPKVPRAHDTTAPNGEDKEPPFSKDKLAAELDIHHWAELEVPQEVRLLGELITPGTRTFLIGTTGIGKNCSAMSSSRQWPPATGSFTGSAIDLPAGSS